jgi:type I restriction enzyme S subunit
MSKGGFKETKVGIIPSEWEVVSLGEVLSEVDIRVRDFENGDASKFDVLSLTKNYWVILQSERFKKRIAKEDVSNYKVIQRGQIVYNPYVIWEGAIHILKNNEIGLVSPVYPVLEAKNNVADPYYLDELLRTPLVIAAYNRFAAGAVNRRRAISNRDFKQIEIPLPPFHEQHAIAHVLSTVSQSIEATQRVIAAARELKRSLMKYLFTYGPVPINQADQVVVKETEIGQVPAHWKLSKLGDVASFKNGINFQSTQKGRGILTVDVLNMYSENQFVKLQNIYRVDKIPREDYLLRQGDMLFVRSSLKQEGVGWPALFPGHTEPVTFCGFIIRARFITDEIIPEFLLEYLRLPNIHQKLVSKSGKVSITNINQGNLGSLVIPIPPISQQRIIVDTASDLINKDNLETKYKDTLETLYQSLLHHLMTGKVRVPLEQ